MIVISLTLVSVGAVDDKNPYICLMTPVAMETDTSLPVTGKRKNKGVAEGLGGGVPVCGSGAACLRTTCVSTIHQLLLVRNQWVWTSVPPSA